MLSNQMLQIIVQELKDANIIVPFTIIKRSTMQSRSDIYI